MARGIPTDVLALLDAGQVVFHGAHKIYADPVQRVWSGHWTLSIDGEDYLPLGATNLATDVSYRVGQVADGLNITLGVLHNPQYPELLKDFIRRVLTDDYRGCNTQYFTLFFDVSGMQLLHAEPDFFGSIDEVVGQRTPGESSIATFKLESEAQGVKRSGGRLCADPDQRLILSTDGSRKYQSRSGEIPLAWYGKPPVRSVALQST
jgi:hypothetical protein